MTAFDRYVVVDWSAAGTPRTGADSIWIADLGPDAAGSALSNPSTRRRAEDELGSVLADARRRGERVLVGVDVSFGYPAGTAAALGIPGEPAWRAMWSWLADRLDDDERNRNDRFAVAAELNDRLADDGPFWGRPPSYASAVLHATKHESCLLAEFRRTDDRLRSLGRRPFSVWQLLGAGSVGSQTLTALPVLWRLVARHGLDVWPFTTGLVEPSVEPGAGVLVEVWPSGFDLDLPVDVARDAAQVDGVARRLRDADRSGGLARWWQPEVDEVDDAAAVIGEEGWTLGVR